MPPFNRSAAFAGSLIIVLGGVTAAGTGAAVELTRTEYGALIFDGVPATATSIPAALRPYLESRAASFVDWLADGSMLIATRFGDTEQLHRLRAPNDAREQLTFERNAVNRAAAHPFDSETFAFLQDHDGDDNTQIFLQQLRTHSITPLTQDAARSSAPLWAHDGKRVAYASNRRNGADFDVYVQDTSTPGLQAQLIAGGSSNNWQVLAWSPDDRQLLLLRAVSAAESYLYVVDVANGELRAISTAPTPSKGASEAVPKSRILGARFAPDGRGILFLSDRDSEYLRLRYVDPGSGELRDLSPQIGADVELFDASADGRYLAYVYNDNGQSRLAVVDQQRKLELSPAGIAAGVICAIKFDRSGKRLALTLESAQSPRDVYVFEADTQTTTRWTQSEVGPVDAARLVAPTLLHFPTWDRIAGQPRPLSALVYRPTTAGMHPVLLLLPSAPASQSRPVFDTFLQYLVNELGFVVIAPNLRGSSGYGRSFAALDDGELREDTLRDIGSLLVWVGAQRDLDRDRVLAIGEGYGGYLTLAALAQYGDRLRGGVDVAGISDFVSYLEGTAPYARDAARAEYGDERDTKTRAFLRHISPLNNAAALRRPVLIVHGLQDRQVPASESEQLLARLRAGNSEVGYLAARDEGHGFLRKPNRDAYYAAVAAFLAQQGALKTEAAP